LVKRLLGVLRGQVDERALFAALRRDDLNLASSLFAQQLFERGPVFEVDGRKDVAGDILLIDVDLLEQRGKEFPRMERRFGLWSTGALACSCFFERSRGHLHPSPGKPGPVWEPRRLGCMVSSKKLWEFLPEKLTAVDDLSAAQMEHVDRQHIAFEVIAEDVGVVAFDGGHALLLL